MLRFFIFITTVAIAVSVTSCRKKGCTDVDADNYNPEATKDDGSCTFDLVDWYTDVVIGSTTYHQLSDTINESVTLTAGENWLLFGAVYIPDGIVLTIEPGTTVHAMTNEGTYLSILQGGMIEACGTAAEPIVFTSVSINPSYGDWVGIILNGRAIRNGGTIATGVGGTGEYGGTNNSDNSGSLCYVRVEYAGELLGTGNELGALTFNTCGEATTLHHLQVFKSLGDGIKFNGGNVNLKYAVSSGSGDDAFAWSEGWVGNAQFWVCEQSTVIGDMALDGKNNVLNPAMAPFSNPILSNITFVGTDDGDEANQGILLSDGTKCDIYNMVLTGFSQRGIQLDGDSCISSMTAAELTIQHSIIDNYYPFKYTASSGNDTVTVLMMDDEDYFNQIASDGSLTGFLSGFIGVDATVGFDPFVIGGWFTSVSYVGAVDPANDWTSGWTADL
jgi:hypothetical protein